VENIQELFPGRQFDLIYVYFGALNTVKDLAVAAGHLDRALAPGGKLVITVINKWYLAGMLLPLLKGKTTIAFQRLRQTWGGYSTSRHLDSKCYTPRAIRKAFEGYKAIRRRGYSIVFPAWYQDGLRKKLGSLAKLLWKTDGLLNFTPFWSKGEYTLFVLERK
jgi:SAM-dependent methyltransferase